jgi:hypothetical protein
MKLHYIQGAHVDRSKPVERVLRQVAFPTETRVPEELRHLIRRIAR